jgi:hypothetical protein
VLLALAGQTREAFAYACNDRHYVNSSGHFVHSPRAVASISSRRRFVATVA